MQRASRVAGKCVWMEAGVLTYKLCDRAFDCERCPLDGVLRAEERSGIPPIATEKDIRIDVALPPDADPLPARLLQDFTCARLREGLSYSRDHMWIRMHDAKLAVIGIDNFFASLLPASARVVFPSDRSGVERGKPLAWIYTRSSVLPVLSPLTGSILRQNRELSEHPALMREDTYDTGWMLSVVPTKPSEEVPALLSCEASRALHEDALATFVRRAYRRLQAHASPEGLCLNDGGIPVSTLDEALGEQSYIELVRAVLFPREAA